MKYILFTLCLLFTACETTPPIVVRGDTSQRLEHIAEDVRQIPEPDELPVIADQIDVAADEVEVLEVENAQFRDAERKEAVQSLYWIASVTAGAGLLLCVGGIAVAIFVNPKLGGLLFLMGAVTGGLGTYATLYMEHVGIFGGIFAGLGVLTGIGIVVYQFRKERKALEEVVYSVETAKNGGEVIDHGKFRETSNMIQSRSTQKEVASIRKGFKRWTGDDIH
tara:strand:+ start:30 stop:695 length:666 start_codon:yes stop_codon:yes gene_type:complete